jgi:hypothetical protein
MVPEQRRNATQQRITTGELPSPRWLTVRPGHGVVGVCDGCGEAIATSDFAFAVKLQDIAGLNFHDECFDVYNRAPGRG